MNESDPRTVEGGSVDTPPDKHLVLSGEGEGVLQFLDVLTPIWSGSSWVRGQFSGQDTGLTVWAPVLDSGCVTAGRLLKLSVPWLPPG